MNVVHHLEVKVCVILEENCVVLALKVINFLKLFWTKTSFVRVSCSDVMAQKEVEGKQLAISAQCDFHIAKGAVWFKLLGLSTANQDG